MWNDDDDTVIGNVTDINTLEFLTAAGVETEGVTANYKAVVKTTTGNEKASNAVAVTHPIPVPPPPPPSP